MLLTLELFPGQGLGDFALGMPLHDAVNLIRKKRSELSCVEIKYATQALFDQDIVINFPEHGMHLRFEPRSQRLRLVEVYDVSRLQVKYGKALTGGASHPATFVRVYDIFGPTYPGEYDEQNRMYSLHYPGVVFLFPIPEQHAQRCRENQIELPLEFPDGSTPLAARICVHAAAEATAQSVTLAAPPPLPASSLYYEVVEARLKEGLHFRGGGQTLRFGDSPQDVWSELGPPSSTVAKGVDTMLIHMKQSTVTGVDYFYNYHSRGLDILFCGKTHRVRKFLLHTNVPGHLDFNIYAKCNFMLVFPDSATSPLLEPLSNGRGAGSSWGSNSATDLTLSSREPSGSGSSSLFAMHPMSELDTSSSAHQDRTADRAAADRGSVHPQQQQQKDSQDGSFWQSLSTLGTDLFGSAGSSSVGPAQQSSPAQNQQEQITQQQQQQQQQRLQTPAVGAAHKKEAGHSRRAALPESLQAVDHDDAPAAASSEADALSTALQGLTINTSDLPQAVTPQDGWDFDCDWDSALISPDGELPALSAAEEGAAVPVPPTDQTWVGFGPTSDITSNTSAPAAAGGGSGGSTAKSGTAVQRQSSQPQVSYPTLFQGGGARGRDALTSSPATADLATASSRSRDRSPFSLEDGPSKTGMDKLHASGSDALARGPVITADSTWEEVQQVLGDGGRATIHSRGFASNPFGPTLVYGYKGVAFEALKNGHLAGLTLFEA